MKKIAASVSLIAFGASALHTIAQDTYLTGDAGKIWNVSASLRGFYDDNANTAVSGGKVDSFGYEVSPSVGINWQRDQNTLTLGYKYSLLYYDRHVRGFRKYEQNHLFNLSFDHAFSERYQMRLNESFAMGQEPDVLRTGNALTTVNRLPGNNIRNDASIVGTAQLTPLLALEAGYNNAIFDYSQEGATFNPSTFAIIPSESGVADRVEHAIHLDSRWQVMPETIAILGYQFSMVDYTGDEIISGSVVPTIPPTPTLMSDARNSRSHYVYVGADHTFTPDLSGSVRVGGRITDYYNDSTQGTDVSPYVRLGLNWIYGPESSVSAGFSYDRNATDITRQLGSSVGGLTVGQQSATVFARVTHRIVPNLFATLDAQYQHSSFIGGAIDGQVEQYYLIGANLEYRFNRYLSAEVGYNYDKIDSDAGRTYDRNRAYVGIRGSY